ncbi:hypothetical protein CHELA20_52723 [Hyphomicrobiales bacterium]|nr:hypothetical protein CHELA41_22204 [Hyphomicrobiales bacterium]CAH1682724.1 hypothetical protein CHELA20_52723 [Hyphomicrobiales bacterium]
MTQPTIVAYLRDMTDAERLGPDETADFV